MEKAIINKFIKINSSKDNVWKVLVTPEIASEWIAEFMAGSTTEGNFILNGIVFYKDNEGNGLKGVVKEYSESEHIKIEYISSIKGGIETTSSEEFEKWKDSYDKYSVKEIDNDTILEIEIVAPKEYEEVFISGWDKCLNKIKELSE